MAYAYLACSHRIQWRCSNPDQDNVMADHLGLDLVPGEQSDAGHGPAIRHAALDPFTDERQCRAARNHQTIVVARDQERRVLDFLPVLAAAHQYLHAARRTAETAKKMT